MASKKDNVKRFEIAIVDEEGGYGYEPRKKIERMTIDELVELYKRQKQYIEFAETFVMSGKAIVLGYDGIMGGLHVVRKILHTRGIDMSKLDDEYFHGSI